MQFHDKLNFLMKIAQVSNKELAKGMSVDPSLVSLWRSGKRKQPQNRTHIGNMALFFAKKCKADFQRSALSELLGQRAISSNMPVEALAGRLENWLTKDPDIAEQLFDGMETVPAKPQDVREPLAASYPDNGAEFYFGEEGRRSVMTRIMQVIRQIPPPGPILISSDDNLEWLLTDYALTKQIQADMMEIIERGFTFYQIMPAINFLPRFVEALRFWLPLYGTGRVKVYYYPRLRDNLYRRSMIILPDKCLRISSAIGLGSSSDVTFFSTNPKVVNAYTAQFQAHLALCRPALSVYSDFQDFTRLFSGILSKQGNQINLAGSLSPNTLPRELLEQIVRETDDPNWKAAFQENLEQISHFENMLTQRQYIEMIRLASPEEIRAGKVCIASLYQTSPQQPVYTPETYIQHLENILRLTEQYENYYFVPCQDSSLEKYNLLVNSDGPALLIRAAEPPLILEMRRPELVMACQEHLLRKAEKAGFDGIHKEKNRLTIQRLIKELQR